MNEAVYKVIEIVGSSVISIDDAIQNAISRSSKSLDHLKWFNVVEVRGSIDDNKIIYQVLLKLGFHVNDDQSDAINFDIASKQKINSQSPAQGEQQKFIAEGGNSQPLAKPST